MIEETKTAVVKMYSSKAGAFSPSIKTSPSKPASATKSDESEASYSVWKKNRPVKHPTFGVGIIQKVEIRSDGGTNITVQFRTGEKKIDGKFLSPV